MSIAIRRLLMKMRIQNAGMNMRNGVMRECAGFADKTKWIMKVLHAMPAGLTVITRGTPGHDRLYFVNIPYQISKAASTTRTKNVWSLAGDAGMPGNVSFVVIQKAWNTGIVKFMMKILME